MWSITLYPVNNDEHHTGRNIMIKQIILYYTILRKKTGKYEIFNNSKTEQLKKLHPTEIINFI